MTNKPWTTAEQKLCCSLYCEGGLVLARTQIGRSDASITKRMSALKVPSPLNVVSNLGLGNARRWYAEDIANMLEMISLGFKISLIAESYNVSKKRINKLLYAARQKGFDSFPKRNV